MPTVIGCLDRAMRAFGGVPDVLVDGQRTHRDHRSRRRDRGPASVDRRGRPPLRGDDRDVRAGRPRVQGRRRKRRCGSPRPIWCRPTPTCSTTTPAGPSSSTPATAFMDKVNGREHRVTRRAPAEMLVEEQARLHRLPDGRSRRRSGRPARCHGRRRSASVGSPTRFPHQLIDDEVWVRVDGDEIVATHVAVDRCGRGRPPPAVHAGHTRIDDAHYPPRPAGRAEPATQSRPTRAEAEFLALGDGARMWLVEAAAAGTSRVKVKMADAVTARPAARCRAGRLGARPRRHLRPFRRRRPRFDPRRAPGRSTTTPPMRTTRCSPPREPGRASGGRVMTDTDRTDR